MFNTLLPPQYILYYIATNMKRDRTNQEKKRPLNRKNNANVNAVRDIMKSENGEGMYVRLCSAWKRMPDPKSLNITGGNL